MRVCEEGWVPHPLLAAVTTPPATHRDAPPRAGKRQADVLAREVSRGSRARPLQAQQQDGRRYAALLAPSLPFLSASEVEAIASGAGLVCRPCSPLEARWGHTSETKRGGKEGGIEKEG